MFSKVLLHLFTHRLDNTLHKQTAMTTFLIAVLFTGWAAASILGTQTYFRGEQTDRELGK
jgi:hypothetical protein